VKIVLAKLDGLKVESRASTRSYLLVKRMTPFAYTRRLIHIYAASRNSKMKTRA
jgi:hypothetical protein